MHKPLARWESRRKQGLARFILNWGVIRFGSVLLVCSIVSTVLSGWLFRRKMAESGLTFELQFGDMIPFLPRLLVIVFGGGAALAAILWCFIESSYRRAQRRD